MPGRSQKVVTLSRGTLSRDRAKCNGSGLPTRLAVTVTGVPRGPFSIADTCETVERSVLVSFTPMISSPGRNPARYAGDPSNGHFTITLPRGAPTHIPTP